MLDIALSPGDKVEIFLKSKQLSKKSFVSRVDEFSKDGTIKIEAPIASGRVVLVPLEHKYALVFTTKSGIVSCLANVVGHYREDGLHFTVFKPDQAYEKQQRRNFFRFGCSMPFKFAVIKDSMEVIKSTLLLDGIIKDLGGGGIRFVSDIELEVQSMIHCVLVIDENYLLLNAKILRCSPLDTSRYSYKFDYSAMFLDITKGDQEIIIKYIFNAQRKQGKRSGV